MNYKIVMDSSSNLLSMDSIDNAAFASVPLKIITDKREFTDDASLDLDDMLSHLASYKGRSGTSCPNVSEWLDAFGDADAVFALAITSALSGSYNAAMQAKAMYEEQHPDRRVCCIDTLSTGPEMPLLAQRLFELIDAGYEFEQIETKIKEYLTHTHMVFMVESLNNMARNGRVSPLIAKTCGLLGIRVVAQASTEGTLQQLHKCRGESKALKTMYEVIKSRGYRGGRIRVDHCRNENGAQTLIGMIKKEFPDCDAQLGKTTGLCSFYAEPGSIMVGFEDL